MNNFDQEYSVFQKALNIEVLWYIVDRIKSTNPARIRESV